MRSSKVVALGAVLAAACAAQPAPLVALWPVPLADSVRVVVAPDAAAAVERLARLTRRTRREQSACVADYAVAQTALHAWVVGIIALAPSEPYDSDSLHVWTRSGHEFCAPGVPNLHTHIVPNAVWGRPSDFDVLQAREWPGPPFRVVVSVPRSGAATFTVYAWVPR